MVHIRGIAEHSSSSSGWSMKFIMNQIQGINPHRQSDFQIDHFIVSQVGSTTYGRYIQSVRKIYQRIQFICADRLEEHELTRTVASPTVTYHHCTKKGLNVVECWNRRLARTATLEELVRLLAHVVVLRRQLGDINHKERSDHESFYWQNRVTAEIAVDLLTEGRVSAATMRFVLALPSSLRRTLLSQLVDSSRRNRLLAQVLHCESDTGDFDCLLKMVRSRPIMIQVTALLSVWRRLEKFFRNRSLESQGRLMNAS